MVKRGSGNRGGGKRDDRMMSGVDNLDRLLHGGIPRDSVVLVSGPPGSGKTVLSLQFIASGAIDHGQKGLYISFEERVSKVRDQAMQFGWDLPALEEQGMVKLVSISKMSLGQIVVEIERAIRRFKPERLVIDSITYISLSAQSRNRIVDLESIPIDEMLYGDDPKASGKRQEGLILRKVMIDLVKSLQTEGICALVTSEVSRESPWYSRDTFTEFACDGVISLKSTSIGTDTQRTLEVVKMRNTPISGGIHTFDFGPRGIKLMASSRY